MTGSTSLLAFILAFAAAAAQPAGAPDAARFRSVELRGGGVVTLVRGPDRRVTVVEGDAGRRIRDEGDRLVIDECARPCPQGHRIAVEIVTPEVEALKVGNGGRIEVRDTFPPQPSLSVVVDNGGMIDARLLAPARVDARIAQGGGIFVHPRDEMEAAISNGGGVTYWGNPRVRSSVRRGGAVAPGDPDDLERPLTELNPALRGPRAPKPPPAIVLGH